MSSLHPDVADDDERILDSLCQFDLLAGLTAIEAAGRPDDRYFYTSLAAFSASRVRPILRRLLRDPELRSAVFGRDDTELAAALAEQLRLATGEAANKGHYFVDYGEEINASSVSTPARRHSDSFSAGYPARHTGSSRSVLLIARRRLDLGASALVGQPFRLIVLYLPANPLGRELISSGVAGKR